MAQGQQTAVVVPVPPRKRRWLRRLLWTLGILVLLVLLAPLALALGPVRDLVADKIGEALDRRVEIDSAFAFWGKGVDLDGITVHSPDGFDGPLATVERVHADLDVLALLGGRLSAAVRVVEPHVTFRRNARDEGNAEGVLEALESDEEEADPESSAAPDLRVVVLGGKVEAVGARDLPATALDDIQITLDLTKSGRRRLSLRAVAREAGQAGADVKLAADLDLDVDGTGPISVEAPPLDLSRLAEIVRGATEIAELGGEFELHGEGRLLADGNLEGKFRAGARNLRGVRRGVEVSVRGLRARANLEAADQGTAADVQLSLGDIQVRRGALDGRQSFRENSVTLTGTLHHNPKSGITLIERARLDAGETATVATTPRLKIEAEPDLRLEGKAYARVDLGRLGRLKELVPALAALEAGALEAHLDGGAGVGLDASALVSIGGLRLAQTSWAPTGYSEPSAIVSLAVRRDAVGVTTLSLRRLESGLVRAVFPTVTDPVQIQLDPDGRIGVNGEFDLHVDLSALSRLVGTSLGLPAGERLEGSMRLRGNAEGTAAQTKLDVRLAVRGLRTPPSWIELGRPADLDAALVVETTLDDLTLDVQRIHGVGRGIDGRARARLRRRAGALGVVDGEASLGANLAQLRPWIGAALGLEPSEQLAGDATVQLRLVDLGGRHRLVTRTQVDGLDWQPSPTAQPVRQPRVVLEADAQLATKGAGHQFEVLKLTADGLSLDLSGATATGTSAEDLSLDATLRLGGDAARLAPALSGLLGEGYEDLRGSGRLGGAMRLRGSPADHARTLLLDGSLDLGAWSTGGVKTTALRVESARPGKSSPLALTLRTVLNGGPTQVGATITLGGPTIPWTANASIKGADTSGVLVSQGLGRYLAYVLPALLPAQATQPVLSGRLIADVSGSSSSLSAPALQNDVRGYGTVSMRQGEIRQSTLFGPNGSGLAKVVAALTVAVPEAGTALQEVSKALTFTSLDSQFRVAHRAVELQRVNLVGHRLNVDMSGRVDFEHRVGLRATATVQGSAGRALAKFLPGGAIPLGISGTLEQPRAVPNVDLKKLLAGAAANVPDLVDRIRKKAPKIPDIFK